jgi:glutathione reductase (NADPH)
MEQDERPVGRLYHQVNGIGKTPPYFSNIYLPRPGVNRCDSGVHSRTNAQCPEGTMPRAFDVIAIGTGSAAAAVASRCREAGWQVAIVDSRPFGGTCALRGCDPKKVLVGAAEALDWTRRMKGKGIQAAKLQIAWPELIRFKRSFTEPVPKRREDEFEKAGIAAFHGTARFAAQTTVQVGKETLVGRYVVIASGQVPADLEIPGAEHLTTSDQFLELDELPRRILFIGGGYIAFEFAHVAARAGSQITVLHRGPRPLALFDPDLVINSLSEPATSALTSVWEPKR